MKSHPMQDVRDRLILAALPHVPFEGWSRRALREGAGDAGLDPSMVGRAFPGGPVAAVDHFCDLADRRLADEAAAQGIESMRLSERIAWLVRRGLWPKLMAGAQALLQRTGIALTSAIAMSGACLLSATLLMADIPMTPVVIVSAALIVAIANPRAIVPLVRQSMTAVPWRAARTVAWVAIPLAAVITVAVRDDAGEDVTGVEQILDDPAAVHISAGEPGR